MSRSSCRIVLLSAVLPALTLVLGCATGTPSMVLGPIVYGNESPTLEIVDPVASKAITQGEKFVIRWSDRDQDSAAKISFTLINIASGAEILLVSNIEENDSVAADQFTVGTSLIPLGSYYIRGEITDGVNASVTSYAMTEGSTSVRVVLTVGEPGTNPLNTPPVVAVMTPAFNQGLAQDDTLEIRVQPSAEGEDENVPYDKDDSTTLYILLDLDDNPENDDPLLPDKKKIILLREVEIAENEYLHQDFNISVDLASIPAREGGLPYYVRATIVDAGNKPVHAYADGTIHILRSAEGIVDLALVGTDLAGARFQGFNPGSFLGTDMTSLGDFDDDGIDDFVLVAQYGNPKNFGNIGEAYLIYGLDQTRFGGAMNVNSVSSSIPGLIIEGSPNRLSPLHADPLAKPLGIKSVAAIEDLTGDGRPEILVGMPMVDGIFQGRDDDPGDDPPGVRVVITARQEYATRRVSGLIDDSLNDDFRGFIDTYVEQGSATDRGGAESLEFEYDAVNEVVAKAALITFDYELLFPLFYGDNFTALPGDPDVTINEARLTLGNVSGAFTAYKMLFDFADTVVYDDFGTSGPTVDVHYENSELDVTGTSIDITDIFTQWWNGELETLIPAILITGIEDGSSGAFDSSEAATEDTRPVLYLDFTIADNTAAPAYYCYPDFMPNNLATPVVPANLLDDGILEALGVAIVIDSENREEGYSAEYPRLESTTMPLELVGQREVGGVLGPDSLLPDEISTDNDEFADQIDASIQHTAVDPSTELTKGIRIQAGFWEYINGGKIGEADPRTGYFGYHIASMPSIDTDNQPDILISAPRNELYLSLLEPDPLSLNADTTIEASTQYDGSIMVIMGEHYVANPLWTNSRGDHTIPGGHYAGSCSSTPPGPRLSNGIPATRMLIYAEDVTDFLGGAEYAGDVNQDGVPDIACGAPLNDSNIGADTGAMYIVYGRRPIGNVPLGYLDDPDKRPPALRIRGEKAGDKIGTVQTHGMDVNGDGISDVFISSPNTDYNMSLSNAECNILDLDTSMFNACKNAYGDDVFDDDACKPYDYDNDRDIDDDDRAVFDCLAAGYSDCCPVDNGFVGVIFGKVTLDGDRTISQIGSNDLKGIKFYGANAGDRAGADISSAGDFNRDGYGDLLISAPGVRFRDNNNRERMGVAYLIFGGTHLNGNLSFSLDQVGTSALPGIVFWSPFVSGSPNEAPIENVGLLGDINNDGFDDIGLGIPRADYLDSSLPQDPNDTGTQPNTGRRPDDGNLYIIYGNNTGSNQ